MGRVSSLIVALAWGLMPFGGFLGGAAIAQFGLPASVVLAACLYLAATLMPLLVPSFRAMPERSGAIDGENDRKAVPKRQG